MFYFLDRKTQQGFCNGSENLCKVLQIRSFFINASFPLDAVGLLSLLKSDSLFFFKFRHLSWLYRLSDTSGVPATVVFQTVSTTAESSNCFV